VQVDDSSGALSELKSGPFDLVLVNRKLDCDYSDGLDVIRAIKADSAVGGVPVMLVTNYPEHQEAAIAVGAVRGFGKLEFGDPATRAKIAEVLE
jgi:two-component system chemotaxis response regulator CheY